MGDFPKVKRKVDREFLDTFHAMRCLACNRRGCDPCHLKTRGSGGDDSFENVIPLCRRHHVEQGQIGFKRFCDKFPAVLSQIEARGWILDDLGRLRRASQS